MLQLLLGDIHGRHLAAAVFSSIPGQAAPSAADIQDMVPGNADDVRFQVQDFRDFCIDFLNQ
jgi:hypothetical protein